MVDDNESSDDIESIHSVILDTKHNTSSTTTTTISSKPQTSHESSILASLLSSPNHVLRKERTSSGLSIKIELAISDNGPLSKVDLDDIDLIDDDWPIA